MNPRSPPSHKSLSLFIFLYSLISIRLVLYSYPFLPWAFLEVD